MWPWKPYYQSSEGTRYGLNVCDPINSYVEILIPQMMVLGDGTFGRYQSHGSRVLMNGISALIKERFLAPFTVWRHRKKVMLWTRMRASPKHDHANTSISDISCQNWEITFCFYKPPSLWYFVIAAEQNKATQLPVHSPGTQGITRKWGQEVLPVWLLDNI